MDVTNNIALRYRETAFAAPEQAALIFPDTAFSRRQFWQLTQTFALRMREQGIVRGTTVCLDAPEATVVLATVLASSLLGARFVQQSGDLDLGRFIEITHRLRTPPPPGAPPGPAERPAGIEIDASWSPGDLARDALRDAAFEGFADPEDPWLIVHTSGTTGYPKFLALSQRIVHDRTMAIRGEFDAASTRLVSLFPASSRPFLSRALGALLHGCPILDGFAPGDWHAAGATMVSGSPTHFKNRLAGKQLSPKLAVAEVIGSNMDDDLTRHLLQSFERIDHAYGSSETNKAFINRRSLGPNGEIVSKGLPRDSEIEVVDNAGKPCAGGEPGMVRIRNGYMAPGYLTDSEAEAMAFRDGWFYPGDRGRWGPDGTLEILGRLDHVINIGGLKVHGLAVDRALKSANGIEDAVCFKNPKPGAADELFAFVVFAQNCNRFQAAASAKYQVEKELGAAMVPRVIREIPAVPRRADGHPDREACAELVLKVAAKQARG